MSRQTSQANDLGLRKSKSSPQTTRRVESTFGNLGLGQIIRSTLHSASSCAWRFSDVAASGAGDLAFAIRQPSRRRAHCHRDRGSGKYHHAPLSKTTRRQGEGRSFRKSKTAVMLMIPALLYHRRIHWTGKGSRRAVTEERRARDYRSERPEEIGGGGARAEGGLGPLPESQSLKLGSG